MPLVFVHGVNVRRGVLPEQQASFDCGVEDRNALFRTIGLAGLVPPNGTLHIENPYWGDHAAKFAYDLMSVPTPGVETFGPIDNAMAQVITETIPFDVAVEVHRPRDGADALLLTLARTHSLAHALDAIVAAASTLETGVGQEPAAQSEELAAFAAAATRYIASDPDTSWLDAMDPLSGESRLQNDGDFLEEFVARIQASRGRRRGVESFGGVKLLDRLKRAAVALADAGKKTFGAVVGAVGGGALGAAIGGAPGVTVRVLRPTATRRAGIFLGDVFVYLADREPISSIVTDALDAALAKQSDRDPRLVVVAHSMGGNIVYDILTSSRRNIRVDLLVTVGSQVALFKELRLYREDTEAKPADPRPARVPKPPAVGTWLNVFDPLDVLGFAAEGVFEGAHDFAFSNQASPLNAHSLYFVRPTFHQRLRARIAEFRLEDAR